MPSTRARTAGEQRRRTVERGRRRVSPVSRARSLSAAARRSGEASPFLSGSRQRESGEAPPWRIWRIRERVQHSTPVESLDRPHERARLASADSQSRRLCRACKAPASALVTSQHGRPRHRRQCLLARAPAVAAVGRSWSPVHPVVPVRWRLAVDAPDGRSADWAEPCKQMDAAIRELAKAHPKALFLEIEAEALPDISESFEVESVPYFVLLRVRQQRRESELRFAGAHVARSNRGRAGRRAVQCDQQAHRTEARCVASYSALADLQHRRRARHRSDRQRRPHPRRRLAPTDPLRRSRPSRPHGRRSPRRQTRRRSSSTDAATRS